MNIHVDIRGFLELHEWICYGFSDQGKDECKWKDRVSNVPVKDDGFFLLGSVGDLHVPDEESVDGRRALVQVDLHLQRRSGAHVELPGDDPSGLPDGEGQVWRGRPFN